jgi:hypothetical protein
MIARAVEYYVGKQETTLSTLGIGGLGTGYGMTGAAATAAVASTSSASGSAGVSSSGIAPVTVTSVTAPASTQTPAVVPLSSVYSSGMELLPRQLVHLISTVSVLACSLVVAPPPLTQPPLPSTADDRVLLPRDDVSLLVDRLIPRVLRDGVAVSSMVEIAMHLCVAEKAMFQIYVRLAKDALTKFGASVEMYKPYAKVIAALLSVEDDNQTWRVHQYFEMHIGLIVTNAEFNRETLKMLLETFALVVNKSKPAWAEFALRRSALNDILAESDFVLKVV